jgi:hypothetical protein
MEDRRQHDRKQPDESLFVCDVRTGAVIGQVANMTEQGVMLLADKPIRPDTRIAGRMLLPDGINPGNTLSFEAECKWCVRDQDSGIYQMGYQFHAISAEAHLSLRKLLATWPELQSEIARF